MKALGHRDTAECLHYCLREIFQITELEICLQMKYIFGHPGNQGSRKKLMVALQITHAVNASLTHKALPREHFINSCTVWIVQSSYPDRNPNSLQESDRCLRLVFSSVSPRCPRGLPGEPLAELLCMLALAFPIPSQHASPPKARWAGRWFSLTGLWLRIGIEQKKEGAEQKLLE